MITWRKAARIVQFPSFYRSKMFRKFIGKHLKQSNSETEVVGCVVWAVFYVSRRTFREPHFLGKNYQRFGKFSENLSNFQQKFFGRVVDTTFHLLIEVLGWKTIWKLYFVLKKKWVKTTCSSRTNFQQGCRNFILHVPRNVLEWQVFLADYQKNVFVFVITASTSLMKLLGFLKKRQHFYSRTRWQNLEKKINLLMENFAFREILRREKI